VLYVLDILSTEKCRHYSLNRISILQYDDDKFVTNIGNLTTQSAKDFLVINPVSGCASRGNTKGTSSLIMNRRSSSSSMSLFIVRALFSRNKCGIYQNKEKGINHLIKC
jgi:hypothetical protein